MGMKYTDEQVKAALRQCKTEYSCNGCPYKSFGDDCFEKLNNDALDLINRQEAEIERLREERDKEKQAITHELRGR